MSGSSGPPDIRPPRRVRDIPGHPYRGVSRPVPRDQLDRPGHVPLCPACLTEAKGGMRVGHHARVRARGANQATSAATDRGEVRKMAIVVSATLAASTIPLFSDAVSRSIRCQRICQRRSLSLSRSGRAPYMNKRVCIGFADVSRPLTISGPLADHPGSRDHPSPADRRACRWPDGRPPHASISALWTSRGCKIGSPRVAPRSGARFDAPKHFTPRFFSFTVAQAHSRHAAKPKLSLFSVDAELQHP
jgi:hypothetical protein